jgi:hypothetical protein
VWSSPVCSCSVCLGDLGLMLEDVGDDTTSTHSEVTHINKQCAIEERGLMRNAWLVPIVTPEPSTPPNTGRQYTAGHTPRTHAYTRIHNHQHTREPVPSRALSHDGHPRLPHPRTWLVRGNSKVFQFYLFFLFPLHTHQSIST